MTPLISCFARRTPVHAERGYLEARNRVFRHALPQIPRSAGDRKPCSNFLLSLLEMSPALCRLKLRAFVVSLRAMPTLYSQPYINVAQFPLRPISNSSRDAGRDLRASPSSDRVAANPKDKAARPPSCGSVAVGLAFATMVGLAFDHNHRQAADGPELASERISLVLDLEDPSPPNRTTSNRERNS